MTVHLRRTAIISLTGLSLLAVGAAPAQAASDASSCVGIIVSTQASAGMLDVDYFKDLAEDLEADNFGQFVRGGAPEHLGNFDDCLAPVLPD